GGKVVVGREAKAEAPQYPDRTFTSVKRFMGRAPADCTLDAALFRYTMDPTEDRFVRFAIGSGERSVTPMEVSAEVLKALKHRAVECLFGEPSGAVITVPAYFDDAQRQATKDAARLAGLEVLRLLNEPTAAAIAYGLDKREKGVFAVYDLGGGTFDISILELNDGIFQVLSTAGDTHLGGDDFDRVLALHLYPELPSLPSGESRQILKSAEQAKRALSERDQVDVQIGDRTQTVTRAQFDALIARLIARTGRACRLALADANLEASQVEAVVLVGGSTRVPAVRSFVAQLFGRDPYCDLNPDEVVALGAAMQADILTGRSTLADDLLLLDVIPLSLGLEVMGGVVEKFIPRCSTIPISKAETFTTHVDNQTAVDLHIVQGDRELARDNRSLARFVLRGLPPLPAGVPRVRVEYLVDADGLLRVSAREEHTGIEAKIEVKPSYGLTDDEIEEMLEASIDHAEDDVAVRMLIEARVEAEGILHALGKSLDDRDLLEEGEEERIQTVRA
ncbi:MAG TPA: Fe-S protein assembly chaperone HscA, partial [Myxococcota bacterium]|nr:Fe-S protein assembly chaperone HscA [Myxococcota bacterium]